MDRAMSISSNHISSNVVSLNENSFSKGPDTLIFQIYLAVFTSNNEPPKFFNGIHAAAKSDGKMAIRSHEVTQDGTIGIPKNNFTVYPMTPNLKAAVDAHWETAPLLELNTGEQLQKSEPA